jgi:hypothetical protein
VDITQLILDQHREQRQMFALIDELTSDDRDALEAIWCRLRQFLDVHALAEERFFYPQLLKIGKGADGESTVEETRDAIKDHNEIRDTAGKVDTQEPGSPDWFAAVAAANKANGDHMAEEERQGLTDFRRHAGLELRHRLGVEFAAFVAAHFDKVEPVDVNPDAYILQNR